MAKSKLNLRFIGIFLGPTLLALGQALIREWIADKSSELGYSDRS